MTAHRKTVELEADANGYAEEDISLYPTSSIDRLTTLMGIRCTTSGSQAMVTVRELEQDDEDETVYHPGDELLYVPALEDGFWYPQAPGDDGSQTALDAAIIFAIRNPKLRVELEGVSGDTCDVEVYYDTAGDQRF